MDSLEHGFTRCSCSIAPSVPRCTKSHPQQCRAKTGVGTYMHTKGPPCSKARGANRLVYQDSRHAWPCAEVLPCCLFQAYGPQLCVSWGCRTFDMYAAVALDVSLPQELCFSRPTTMEHHPPCTIGKAQEGKRPYRDNSQRATILCSTSGRDMC